MKKQTEKTSHFNRLRGQLLAVEEMLKKNAKIGDVIQQLEAARSSIKSLEKRLIMEKIATVKDQEVKKIVNYLCKLG